MKFLLYFLKGFKMFFSKNRIVILILLIHFNLLASDKNKKKNYCKELEKNAYRIQKENQFENIITGPPSVCGEISLAWRFADCARENNQENCQKLYKKFKEKKIENKCDFYQYLFFYQPFPKLKK